MYIGTGPDRLSDSVAFFRSRRVACGKKATVATMRNSGLLWNDTGSRRAGIVPGKPRTKAGVRPGHRALGQ